MGMFRASSRSIVPGRGVAAGRCPRLARVLLVSLAFGYASCCGQQAKALALSASAPPGPSATSQAQAYARHEAAIAHIGHAECDPDGPSTQDYMLADTVQGRLTATLNAGISAEQASCAREIYEDTISAGYDEHAAVIEVCAAITEANLFNDTGGDGTSVGLFQMIDALGTTAQREDVSYETTWFLNAMSNAYPDGSWEGADVGDVDQAVEISAYPDRYEPNADDAQTIVSAIVALESGGGDSRGPRAIAPAEHALRLRCRTAERSPPRCECWRLCRKMRHNRQRSPVSPRVRRR